VQESRTKRIFLTGEVDRSPGELDRSRRRTGLTGDLGRPGAQLGQVKPREPGSIGHGGPERKRPLEVPASLRQAE